MRIVLNGTPLLLEEGRTLLDLIRAQGLIDAPVVMEVNGVVVKKTEWNRPLAENDRIEALSFVGGG